MSQFVSFGEVLLRLSAHPETRLQQAANLDVVYGGSEANVAAALAQWGVAAAHVTVLPDHDLGLAALRALRSHGVNTSFVRQTEGRLGIYFLEHGAHVRSPKVVYDRFETAFAKSDPPVFPWSEILSGATWFHWSGITPAISATAAEACKQAITTARAKNCTISADINYRRVLWQYGKQPAEVMPELMAMSDVLIGGAADFENCLGIRLNPNATLDEIGHAVKPQLPRLRWLATTIRKTHDANHQELQGVLWDGQQLWHSRNYVIHPIIDRVGSGDAFAAGLAFAKMNGREPQNAIEFATAAAVYKHTMHGDVLCCSPSEVEEVIQGTHIGKLLR